MKEEKKAWVRPPHPFDLKLEHYQKCMSEASFGFLSLDPDPVLDPSRTEPILHPLRWGQAFPTHDMVYLAMIASGRAGPLEPAAMCSYRCSEDNAAVAAIISLVYSYARECGMLKGKPPYEAWEMFVHRVETARHEAHTVLRWAEVLCKKSNVNWSAKIPTEWQVLVGALSGQIDWSKLRSDRDFWSRTITAGKMMTQAPGWRYQLYTFRKLSEADGDTFTETLEEAP
jgi:hypothetical protein